MVKRKRKQKPKKMIVYGRINIPFKARGKIFNTNEKIIFISKLTKRELDKKYEDSLIDIEFIEEKNDVKIINVKNDYCLGCLSDAPGQQDHMEDGCQSN